MSADSEQVTQQEQGERPSFKKENPWKAGIISAVIQVVSFVAVIGIAAFSFDAIKGNKKGDTFKKYFSDQGNQGIMVGLVSALGITGYMEAKAKNAQIAKTQPYVENLEKQLAQKDNVIQEKENAIKEIKSHVERLSQGVETDASVKR